MEVNVVSQACGVHCSSSMVGRACIVTWIGDDPLGLSGMECRPNRASPLLYNQMTTIPINSFQICWSFCHNVWRSDNYESLSQRLPNPCKCSFISVLRWLHKKIFHTSYTARARAAWRAIYFDESGNVLCKFTREEMSFANHYIMQNN